MDSIPNITPVVRALAAAAPSLSVCLRALHEQPPAFGSLRELEPNRSETAARLVESDDRCFFGAFFHRLNRAKSGDLENRDNRSRLPN